MMTRTAQRIWMEETMHRITMLGTGLIGMFYTQALHEGRSRDRVQTLYSRSEERASQAAKEWGVPRWTTDLAEAISDRETDVVVIGLPNHLHREAIVMAAEAGKAVLCTKPLARTAPEALECLQAVERAGVFGGYLEDLVYSPKMLKAIQSVQAGAVGRVLWTRSRETHSGPHSAWFWDPEQAGGGAIIDLGCHCIEQGRVIVGKDVRPVEVMCWGATHVHPIPVEDNAVGLIRYASGALGQFEVSWAFRGGMDLREEIAGTEGTIWINHWLRTGFEMFTGVGQGGYVSEKTETDTGWLFPVGDELGELGYNAMFADMLNALDEGRQPMETLYDGYVVNAIMDACYRSMASKRWEPVQLDVWRGRDDITEQRAGREYDEAHFLVKEEVMPDGRTKLILQEKETGKIVQKVVEASVPSA
jgi:predicted dehydrogenase